MPYRNQNVRLISLATAITNIWTKLNTIYSLVVYLSYRKTNVVETRVIMTRYNTLIVGS